MIKCVGFTTKKGTFTSDDGKDIEYNNTVLYVTTDETSDDELVGNTVATIKIKNGKVKMQNFTDYKQLVGKEIGIGYSLGDKPTVNAVYLK